MPVDIEEEKDRYCETVNINENTYQHYLEIDRRIRRIFKTFSRTLKGRSKIPQNRRDREIKGLVELMRTEVALPLLYAHSDFMPSQDQFDAWHEGKILLLKASCPISSKRASQLTVGMSQKLINLLCKDIWALNLIPSRYSRFFHPVIDQITLDALKEKGKLAWTRIDSYEVYMELQLEFRKMAREENTYPLVVECEIWNDYRLKRNPKRIPGN